MTLRKTVGTVGTLAQGAVSTAVSVARHPIGSAALAAGLVKGTAEAGLDLVRSTVTGSSPHAAPTGTETAAAPETPETPTAAARSEPEVHDRDLPGPDVVAAEVRTADDLPEAIVIEAEPAAEAGEAFHTEPKAASRASAHGGLAGDREEAAGYVEEIPQQAGDDIPVWTSETPTDEPVLDSAVAKAVRSEAEVLQKAADQHKE